MSLLFLRGGGDTRDVNKPELYYMNCGGCEMDVIVCVRERARVVLKTIRAYSMPSGRPARQLRRR